MDIKKIVENYYNPKSKLDFDLLCEMVEHAANAFEPLSEEKQAVKTEQAKEFILSLPKFTPSEAWGEPSSEAREQIMKYVIRATPYGKPTKLEDFQKYIDYFTRIFSEESKIRSPGRIISTIVLMESLASTLNSFGASTAGFIFEGWLAAMLGGKQEAERTEKGNLPIQDIVAFQHPEFPGIPMSLKLLTQKEKGRSGTNIEGSYTNLVDAMDEYGQMPYIVALKEAGGGGTGAITVHMFNITQDNLAQVISIRKPSLLAQVEGSPYAEAAEAGNIIEFYSSLSWEERYRALQWSAGYSEKIRDKYLDAPTGQSAEDEEKGWEQKLWDEHPEWHELAVPRGGAANAARAAAAELKESLVRSAEDLNEAQKFGGAGWHLTQTDMMNKGNASILQHTLIGRIDLTSEGLVEAVARHMDYLDEVIVNLFNNVKNLSDNLNQYFVRPKRDRALRNGEEAVVNAENVKAAAEGLVKKEKQEK